MGSQVNKLWALQLPAHIRSRQAASGSRADMVADRLRRLQKVYFIVWLGVEIIFGPDPRSQCHPHFASPAVISVLPRTLQQG